MPDPTQPPLTPKLGPSLGPVNRADFLSLLRADQRFRWRRGQRVAAEAYVDQLPILNEDHAALVDLIVGEMDLRHEAGELCGVDEYQRRFPKLAGPITWRLSLHSSAVGCLLPSGETHIPTVPSPPQPESVEPTPYDPIPLHPAKVDPAAADIAPPPAGPDEPTSPAARAWGWCRRHPAPATGLTAVAACVVLAIAAAPFAGQARSTAPPADGLTPVDTAELQQLRERATRAERDAAAAQERATADAAARDEALRQKEAAEARANKASTALGDVRRTNDQYFADVVGRDLSTGPHRERLLTAAKAHYEAIIKESSDDPARRAERGPALLRLGLIAEARGQDVEAVGRLRQAVDVPTTVDNRPLLAAAYTALGRIHRRGDQLAESEAAGRKSVQTWDAVVAANPAARRELAHGLREWADTLAAAKRSDDAIAAYRRAIETSKGLPDASGGDLAVVWGRLADCFVATGQAESAIDARRQAVELYRQQAGRTPDDAEAAEVLAEAVDNLAGSFSDPEGKAQGYEEAVTAWERVTRLRPTVVAPKAKLAEALDHLSDAQRRIGRDDADRTADQAVAVRERLVADHPGTAEHESALAAAYSSRGERLRDRNRGDDAAADFRRAAPLLGGLVNRSPQNRGYVVRLSINEMSLAQLDLRKRRIEPARAGFARALARLDGLDGSDDVAVNRAVCCANLAHLAAMGRQPTDARDWYDRAEQLLGPLAEHPHWKDFVSAVLADCARGRDQLR